VEAAVRAGEVVVGAVPPAVFVPVPVIDPPPVDADVLVVGCGVGEVVGCGQVGLVASVFRSVATFNVSAASLLDKGEYCSGNLPSCVPGTWPGCAA
jgi:hypothetical protein